MGHNATDSQFRATRINYAKVCGQVYVVFFFLTSFILTDAWRQLGYKYLTSQQIDDQLLSNTYNCIHTFMEEGREGARTIRKTAE